MEIRPTDPVTVVGAGTMGLGLSGAQMAGDPLYEPSLLFSGV